MIYSCWDCGEEIALDDDSYPYCWDCEEAMEAGDYEDGDEEDYDPYEEDDFDRHFGGGYDWEDCSLDPWGDER